MSCELASQDEKGLSVVVLRRNVKVGALFLAMKVNVARLDFALKHINLVATQDNGNVVATNSHQITMPTWHRLVCGERGHIKHNDGSLCFGKVTITQAAKLVLASAIPDIKDEGAIVCVKGKRVDINAKCGDVLVLKVTSAMALDKGGFANTTLTNQNKLEAKRKS